MRDLTPSQGGLVLRSLQWTESTPGLLPGRILPLHAVSKYLWSAVCSPPCLTDPIQKQMQASLQCSGYKYSAGEATEGAGEMLVLKRAFKSVNKVLGLFTHAEFVSGVIACNAETLESSMQCWASARQCGRVRGR